MPTTIAEDPRIARYRNVTDLQKFDRKYKVINDGTNGDEVIERIWELCIPGIHGQIFPWGFNGDLAVLSEKARIIRKLQALGLKAVQGQVVFRFPANQLDVIASVISARRSRKGKGRKFTPAELAVNTARLKAWHEAQKKKAGSANSKP